MSSVADLPFNRLCNGGGRMVIKEGNTSRCGQGHSDAPIGGRGNTKGLLLPAPTDCTLGLSAYGEDKSD